MSRAARVLVIYKRSAYQRYRAGQDDRIAALLAANDPSVEGLLEEHEAHLETVESAKVAFRRLGVEATFRHRHEPDHGDDWDLVVTLGGDGTLLWASHLVDADTPMVAINSAPKVSVGYFCAADSGTLDDALRDALSGRLRTTRLTRMKVVVDDDVVSMRVLNDALFCHESPAITTRYWIELGDVRESHLSSGLWAGPAAGSTAAQRSAGGKVLPLKSQKLQFVVREPYRGADSGYRLARGLVSPGEELRLISCIRDGQLFLDGAQKVHPVDLGSVVTMSRSEESLTLLGLRDSERG